MDVTTRVMKSMISISESFVSFFHVGSGAQAQKSGLETKQRIC